MIKTKIEGRLGCNEKRVREDVILGNKKWESERHKKYIGQSTYSLQRLMRKSSA